MRSSVVEQVAEVGARIGQEPPPGLNEVEVLPPGWTDAPVAQFQDARAGDGGDERRMGGDYGLGTVLGYVVQQAASPRQPVNDSGASGSSMR
jgi:hypothetical protein